MLRVSSNHPQDRLEVKAEKEELMGPHFPRKTATGRTAGGGTCCQRLCQGLVWWRASAGTPSEAAWASCAPGKQPCRGPRTGRGAVATRGCPRKGSSGVKLSEQIFPRQRDLGTRSLQTCSQHRLCTGDDFRPPLPPVLTAHCEASVWFSLE